MFGNVVCSVSPKYLYITHTWLNKYLMNLTASEYFEYMNFCLNWQIWKILEIHLIITRSNKLRRCSHQRRKGKNSFGHYVCCNETTMCLCMWPHYTETEYKWAKVLPSFEPKAVVFIISWRCFHVMYLVDRKDDANRNHVSFCVGVI